MRFLHGSYAALSLKRRLHGFAESAHGALYT